MAGCMPRNQDLHSLSAKSIGDHRVGARSIAARCGGWSAAARDYYDQAPLRPPIYSPVQHLTRHTLIRHANRVVNASVLAYAAKY
jgi:hypothetical protein